jgi:hypothetical protein
MDEDAQNKIKIAGDHICKWYQHCMKSEKGHWDNIGYKQGLRDALHLLKRHKVIKDYSFITGVTLHAEKEII